MMIDCIRMRRVGNRRLVELYQFESHQGTGWRRVPTSILQAGWVRRAGFFGHGVNLGQRRVSLASVAEAINCGQAKFIRVNSQKDIGRPMSPTMRSHFESLGLDPAYSYRIGVDIRPAQALAWGLLPHDAVASFINCHTITDEEACRHGLADLVLGPDLWAWVQGRFGPVRRIDPQFLNTIWESLRSTGPEYLARALEKIFPRLGELRLAHEARQQQAYEDTLYV